MGWFKHKQESQKISELQDSFEKLKRDVQNLELEWSNFYDKARRLLARVVKRAEIVEKAEEKEMGGAGGPSPLPISPSTGRLTDRQREIQQQILRRRAGG